MKVLSSAKDNRIGSINVYAEMTFGEYLELAPNIIKNNQFQRKRVKTSKSVYSLLKKDLQNGCIMPPLVLAFTGKVNKSHDSEKIVKYMIDHSESILILDGLQRTYTLIDAADEISDAEELSLFHEYKLRVEVYYNINKFGVLYRMLTLNTGQTPMSARHQIEMLYSDMLNTEVDGIKLISDMDGTARPSENEFLFKNVVEGFHSYMNRDELPIDRQELLENIKMLEKMSEESIDSDIFKEFLECYIGVFQSLRNVTIDRNVSAEELSEYGIMGSPFGVNVSKVFSSSQALTGFGAAVGRMKDKDVITGFESISNDLKMMEESNNGMEWFLEMLRCLDRIRDNSKKIGNAQRMFFQYFFRELFNKDGDSFLNLENAVENGYKKYQSQV